MRGTMQAPYAACGVKVAYFFLFRDRPIGTRHPAVGACINNVKAHQDLKVACSWLA